MGDKKTNKEQEKAFQTLAAQFFEVHKLLAQGAEGDTAARYRLGVLVEEAAHKSTYGSRAVGKIAAEFGITNRAARYHHDVARTWVEKELLDLAHRRGPSGNGLTFTHFIWLAQVHEEKKRTELLEATLAGSLTVRELRERAGLAKAKVEESPAETQSKKEKLPPDALAELVYLARQLNEKLIDFDAGGALDGYLGEDGRKVLQATVTTLQGILSQSETEISFPKADAEPYPA